jgi:hypothetical protein
VDANKAVTDVDRIIIARRVFNIPPWTANAEQDYVLDISKNGVVDDPDRIAVARLVLVFALPPCS